MGSKSLSNSKKKNKKSNKSKDERNVPSSASEQTSISHDRDKKKIITDARFSSVHSDPRFQNVPKHKAKVAIDSRFDRMFVDKRFSSSSAPLDKRGRPKKGKSENPLRHYYKIEEKSEKGEDDSEEDVEVEKEEEDDSDTVGSNVEVEKKNQRLEKPDSSSELEESESEDDDAETGESDYTTDTDAGDLDEIYDDETPELPVENIPEIDKETHRLAVVNLDWRHVKAVDLYVVLSSFLPKGGQILSVAVYPSEFGLQRMKEEELHGPIGLFDDEQEENDEDDDEEMDNEKLRAYEMSRLRYYYAVVECDSIATADYLYKTCDGVEFERSSNVLDLRFIPDSIEFKHPPRDISTEAPSSYEVLNFHTPALQHSKIQLSWDEDEPQREKALKRKFNADQLADLELKEFLASSESESDIESDDGVEDQTDKKRKKGDKYRALLQSDEDGEQDGGQDMEVTFNTGLEDISKRILEKKDKKSETLWEAHLRKRREKRENAKSKSTRSSDDESSDTDREAGEEAGDFFVEEPPVKESKKGRTKNIKDREHVGKDGEVEAEASRAELELLLADDEGVDTGIKGYNLKHKKKKGKEDIAEDKIPTVDYNDPRFSALFNSPLFALDPTDPQFKRSAAYVRQVALKQQKGDGYQLTKSEHGKSSRKQPAASGEDEAKDDVPVNTEGESSKKEKYELSSLVKSIKMKSKQLQLQSGGGKMPKEDGKKRLRATEEELQPPATMNKSGKKKQRKMKVTAD